MENNSLSLSSTQPINKIEYRPWAPYKDFPVQSKKKEQVFQILIWLFHILKWSTIPLLTNSPK